MQFIFAFTLFVSATLLFWVQPMFSRMVLPLLGGVPAVWNTCLVFYQTTLLLGYAYAHFTAKWLRIRTQLVVHLTLLWGTLFTLSFTIEYHPVSQSHPVLWLFQIFFTSIGLPFFVLSTMAPMLQWWFAHLDHPHAQNPYVFYAVSNVGSLFALLSYPLLVEPFLTLHSQHRNWMLGYGILAALLSCCAILWLIRSSPHAKESPFQRSIPDQPITMSHRFRWMILAFIPSSLLLGVTRHITTDIAAIPLFWVIPLSLYLLTFVLVFARIRLLQYGWMLKAQTFLVLPLLVIYLGRIRTGFWLDFPIQLIAFFVFTMVCHGELVRSRPSPQRLTEFYLWMSLGGCLGGIFTALLAPMLFNSIVEYPLMIALVCLIRPVQKGKVSHKHIRWLFLIMLVSLLLYPIGLASGQRELVVQLGTLSLFVFTSCAGALFFSVLNTPKRVALGLGSFLLVGFLLVSTQQDVLVQQRNFFGTLRVTRSADSQYHLFYHGTTLHGAQHTVPDNRREPLTYFHRKGPLGQIFEMLDTRAPQSIAVFGLGVGTIASYIREGDHVTFYEIDPDVEQVARNTDWFSYLDDCAGQLNVILGDARISLTSAPDYSYSMIIQDAFSSDTIPVHLLTREAFQLYKSKLTEDGILVFNITNRHLNLEPVLAALIEENGMSGLIRRDTDLSKAETDARKYPSVWVIATQREEDLGSLQQDSRWKPLQDRPGIRVWTDDYSNILAVRNYSHYGE